MPFTAEHRKEFLGRAYVRAVAAAAGVVVASGEPDYGRDLTLSQVSLLHGKLRESGVSLDFQLKSSAAVIEGEGELRYDLDVDAHNGMVSRPPGAPLLLLLYRLPHDEAEWLSIDEESLLMRRCCYWHRVTGSVSSNTTTVRIAIPRIQLFDAAALTGLLDEQAAGLLP